MADTAAIMPARMAEDTCFTHTPATLAFAAFLAQLTSAIESERDLEGMSAGDPAFDGWLRNAELSWEEVSNRARAAFEARVERCADRPLRYAALLIHFAMGSQSREEFESLRALYGVHRETFGCDEAGPVAHRVNLMLETALERLDDIGRLEMIADDSEARTAPVCMFA